jgi:hypothetical protein
MSHRHLETIFKKQANVSLPNNIKISAVKLAEPEGQNPDDREFYSNAKKLLKDLNKCNGVSFGQIPDITNTEIEIPPVIENVDTPRIAKARERVKRIKKEII